jgi:hypothetical protein
MATAYVCATVHTCHVSVKEVSTDHHDTLVLCRLVCAGVAPDAGSRAWAAHLKLLTT